MARILRLAFVPYSGQTLACVLAVYRIRDARQDDEVLAAAQEEGQGGEVGVDVALVDARLVEPDLWRVVGTKGLGPVAQGLVLGRASVVPRMANEALALAE